MRFREAAGLIKVAGKDFVEDQAPQLSAAIAYYTIFSVAPLLLIAITLASLFLSEKTAQGQVVAQARQYVGETGGQAIESMVNSARRSGGGTLATILSICVALFGASNVVGQLQSALNTIWEVPPRRSKGIVGAIRTRGVAFLVVVGIGLLLLASAVVSAILTNVTTMAASVLPGKSLMLYVADFAGTTIITFALFALLFKVLPDIEIAWRDVWIGAAITALLFAVGKIGIGFYLGRSSVASSYGLAGSVILLLLWAYYSSMIVLFGAELTQAYAAQYGSHIGAIADPERRRAKFKFASFDDHGQSEPAWRKVVSKTESNREAGEPMKQISSESEYLQNEAELAKRAIGETIGELAKASMQAANPTVWTRQYPWAAVGVAAVAGAVVGKAYLGRSGLAAIQEALLGRAPSPPRTGRDRAASWRDEIEQELERLKQRESRATPSGLSQAIKRGVFRLVKTALKGSLMAAISAGTAHSTAKATAEDTAEDVAGEALM